MENKQIIIFLGVAQGILFLFNGLVYALLTFFFPSLDAYKTILLIVLFFLAISFLTFSMLTMNRQNGILRYGYILSSVWVVFSFYFVGASLVALILGMVFSTGYYYFGLVALLVGVGLTAYGLINARIVQLTEIKVTLPNLPEFWKNKTAVMVSDTHLGLVLRQGFINKVINFINKLEPEIVFLPGDFYDGVHTGFSVYAEELKKVKAPQGIYFCSGNHELFAGYAECELALKDAGVKILENEKVEVNGLQIAGVAYKSDTLENLPIILEQLKLNKNLPSILLKHVPLQVKEVADAGFNLMFCGHSHHGQIWPGSFITKRVFKGFDYGLKAFNQLLVYTSSGVGTWGPPTRVFTKSEIVKITFL